MKVYYNENEEDKKPSTASVVAGVIIFIVLMTLFLIYWEVLLGFILVPAILGLLAKF